MSHANLHPNPLSGHSEDYPEPMVSCDLCQWPMPVPEISRERGAILGLLVCTACVEDQLEAQL